MSRAKLRMDALPFARSQLAQQPSNVRSKFKTPDGAWTLHNAKVRQVMSPEAAVPGINAGQG